MTKNERIMAVMEIVKADSKNSVLATRLCDVDTKGNFNIGFGRLSDARKDEICMDWRTEKELSHIKFQQRIHKERWGDVTKIERALPLTAEEMKGYVCVQPVEDRCTPLTGSQFC